MLSYKRIIRISDCDHKREVPINKVVEILGDCGQADLDVDKKINTLFSENNIYIYISYWQVDFLETLKYGNELTVKTWPYDLNQIMGYRNTIIYDKNKLPVVTSYSVGPFVDVLKQKPTRIPKEFLADYHFKKQFNMEYLPRTIQLPDITPTKGNIEIVPSYFIDMYGHVNNAKYLLVAQDYVNKDRYVKTLRVQYLKPAVLGDTLIPYVYKTEDSTYVKLVSREDETYCLIEFIYQ
jgi:acyl-ACP thioesterase